jgi:type IV pilus assembly protein PilY1
MVATPAVLGGIVFFPTFVPDSDVCIANGTSYLYALYYVTGGAYSEAVIGTTASGANQMVNRSTSLGQGLATTVALHIGAQGNGGAGGGSRSGLTGCSQSSTGALNCVNVNPAMGTTSRYLSWINQRD